jgi:outer membrane protein assembly factor BamA
LENFVWFSDEEIVRAIRQDVPFFDGTSPETGTTAEKIAASLRRLLKAKNIAGVVEFLPYADLNTGKQELMFTVKGVKIPVCSVQFPGATAVPEAELIRTAQPLLSMEYSRKDASVFTQLNLFPLYRRLGYLRADFKQPTAVVDENAGARCAGGVAVTIPVEEGTAYSWAEAAWSGNQTLTNDELSAALGMKVGELADGLKIDKGIKAVKQAYGRKGYLAAQIHESTEFEAQRVSFQFTVREGPQYHMGALTVIGLSSDDAAELKKKWTMAPGDVFDGSYIEGFMKTSVRELVQRTRGSAAKRVGSDLKLDRQNRTVDVVIAFK